MIGHDHRAVLGPDQRRVKRAAAEIKHQPVGLGVQFLVPVGECRRHGLLQQQRGSEAGQFRGPLGGIALVKLECRRHSEHRRRDLLAFSLRHVAPQRLQYLRGQLFRTHAPSAGPEVILKPRPHASLELEHHVLFVALVGHL